MNISKEDFSIFTVKLLSKLSKKGKVTILTLKENYNQLKISFKTNIALITCTAGVMVFINNKKTFAFDLNEIDRIVKTLEEIWI